MDYGLLPVTGFYRQFVFPELKQSICDKTIHNFTSYRQLILDENTLVFDIKTKGFFAKQRACFFVISGAKQFIIHNS
jgi:hypothetical protein